MCIQVRCVITPEDGNMFRNADWLLTDYWYTRISQKTGLLLFTSTLYYEASKWRHVPKRRSQKPEFLPTIRECVVLRNITRLMCAATLLLIVSHVVPSLNAMISYLLSFKRNLSTHQCNTLYRSYIDLYFSGRVYFNCIFEEWCLLGCYAVWLL
jgi:hypothetical protein